MTDVSELRFYQTAPSACGYIKGEESTNIFVDPDQALNAHVYSLLSEFGFRRSGDHVYRPHCGECQACIPFRVLTDLFHPSRSQRRCIKRNQDLRVSVVNSIQDDRYFELYQRYINERHSDGEMFPANREQYDGFLSSEWGATRYLVMHDQHDTLVSVAVCDQLQNGLSAMYTFFSPDEDARSLGVFNILYQIQWAREQNLPYLYLGYWIKQSQKMAYKENYRPFQLLRNNQWQTFHQKID